jgi:cyclophilin family peptidyl-prolyl cis-trans isomerase
MEYTLESPPNSGPMPRVKMEIKNGEKSFGILNIELDRDAFPLGVENFLGMCRGNTYRVESVGYRPYKGAQVTQRAYECSNFYGPTHNNWISGGDIDTNDGSSSSSIYNDLAFPRPNTEWTYIHDRKGIISLVPFYDQETERCLYDSNFLITLDDPLPTNGISQLNDDHIVIGCVYDGLDVLDRMNEMIMPFRKRAYPDFRVGKCDVVREIRANTRRRPVITNITKFAEAAKKAGKLC